MVEDYTFVDGAHLTRLILDVRDDFHARPECDDALGRRPNTVRAVALDRYTSRSVNGKLAILRDLIECNADLLLTQEAQDVFAHSDGPATYLADLVREVVAEVLLRDPGIYAEDTQRAAAAREPLDEIG